MTQLDLFTDVAPTKAADAIRRSGEVIAFPIERDAGLIRQTARQLERRHGPAADKWWQTQCRRLYARLQVQGMADADIRAAVDRFARAVYAEIVRSAAA